MRFPFQKTHTFTVTSTNPKALTELTPQSPGPPGPGWVGGGRYRIGEPVPTGRPNREAAPADSPQLH